MEFLIVIGAFGFGWILPELSVLIGSGKHPAPAMLNVVSALSSVAIAAGLAY